MRRVRRSILPLVLAAAAFAPARPAASVRTLLLPDTPVEFIGRDFQPGEAVLAELTDRTAVRSVSIRLGGRNYRLGPDRPFVLIGLDLDLPAKALPFELDEITRDGAAVKLRRELLVAPREFSSSRFWVSQAMLTPPREESERVRREQILLQGVFNVVTPAWRGDGNFIAPLAQEPSPNFGQRRIYNRTTTSVHVGVDFGAPWGTAIRASNAGRIVLASQLYLSGWTVIIDHGRGVFTFYAHCSKFLVKRGDLVRKGQAIARVGNTGRSTGPHLHWSARIGDCRVDPLSLLALPLGVASPLSTPANLSR